MANSLLAFTAQQPGRSFKISQFMLFLCSKGSQARLRMEGMALAPFPYLTSSLPCSLCHSHAGLPRFLPQGAGWSSAQNGLPPDILCIHSHYLFKSLLKHHLLHEVPLTSPNRILLPSVSLIALVSSQ